MPVNKEAENQELFIVDHRYKQRWTTNKKTDAVMRLLRGESLDGLSRELHIEAHRLATWRDDFLEGGRDSLKRDKTPQSDRRLKEAQRKIGELTMYLEIWKLAAQKKGVQIPPRRRVK